MTDFLFLAKNGIIIIGRPHWKLWNSSKDDQRTLVLEYKGINTILIPAPCLAKTQLPDSSSWCIYRDMQANMHKYECECWQKFSALGLHVKQTRNLNAVEGLRGIFNDLKNGAKDQYCTDFLFSFMLKFQVIYLSCWKISSWQRDSLDCVSLTLNDNLWHIFPCYVWCISMWLYWKQMHANLYTWVTHALGFWLWQPSHESEAVRKMAQWVFMQVYWRFVSCRAYCPFRYSEMRCALSLLTGLFLMAPVLMSSTPASMCTPLKTLNDSLSHRRRYMVRKQAWALKASGSFIWTGFYQKQSWIKSNSYLSRNNFKFGPKTHFEKYL